MGALIIGKLKSHANPYPVKERQMKAQRQILRQPCGLIACRHLDHQQRPSCEVENGTKCSRMADYCYTWKHSGLTLLTCEFHQVY